MAARTRSAVGCFLLLFWCCSSIMPYRFICDGLMANGEEHSDECGICDEAHAARWLNPSVPVVVDEGTLPQGLSRHAWQEVLKKSFAAWNDVSGSGFNFVPVEGQSLHQLGANEELHEIFWITDKYEWRKLVGGGEFGILGATLPRYSCGDGGSQPRVIYDADLALNGLPGIINWQVDCDNEDCLSIQGTLVHELGHFLGLDHPCLFCNTSIMSARAGFDIDHPILDDMEGLRALYPDGETGGFGSLCHNDNECSRGNLCFNDVKNSYCTNICDDGDDCQPGAICEKSNGERRCVFSDGEASFGKAGDSCSFLPCTDPLICAGLSQMFSFCFTPCDADRSCGPGQTCVTTDDSKNICIPIRHPGEECSFTEFCDGELVCAFESDGVGYCRTSCDKERYQSGCREGFTCDHSFDAGGICIPNREGLALDDISDTFQPWNISPSKGGARATSDGYRFMGCHSVFQENISNISWLLLLAVWILVRQRRERKRRSF